MVSDDTEAVCTTPGGVGPMLFRIRSIREVARGMDVPRQARLAFETPRYLSPNATSSPRSGRASAVTLKSSRPMSNPRAIISELRSYLDDLASEVGKLQDQVERLQDKNEQLTQENKRLQQENKSLREEVTVVRLYQEVSEDEDVGEEPSSSVSRQALILYRELPAAFKFAEFFQIADQQDIDPAVAREALLQLLREDMLVQKGARIEKSEPASRRFEVEKHMQPSRL